jgi:site-specific recombinase XerD
MTDELRNNILTEMSSKLSESQLADLQSILDIQFNQYNIERKSTELAVIDETNTIVLKNFLNVKLLEGKSPGTLKLYKYTIETILGQINKNIDKITTNDLRQWFAEYKVRDNISPVTLNNRRVILNSFFKWCCNEGYVRENPVSRIAPFKEPKKHVNAFTSKEIETLCDACKSTRDRAIIEFLYSTGCRVTECSNMNISDVDFKENTAIIQHGKGDKERLCYISEKAMYWLEKYLNERKDQDIALFTGRKGRLTKAGIEYVIRKLGNETGIDAHPHKFRHTLATNLVQRNAPIQQVQRIMGHESLDTTMVYVDLDDSEIHNTHTRLII